jgi:hypothetical protein
MGCQSVRTQNDLHELHTIPDSGKVTDATSAVTALKDTDGAIPELTKCVRITAKGGTLLISTDGQDPTIDLSEVLLQNNAAVLSVEDARAAKLSGAKCYSKALTY